MKYVKYGHRDLNFMQNVLRMEYAKHPKKNVKLREKRAGGGITADLLPAWCGYLNGQDIATLPNRGLQSKFMLVRPCKTRQCGVYIPRSLGGCMQYPPVRGCNVGNPLDRPPRATCVRFVCLRIGL